MSNLIARILLSILLFPLAALVYLVVCVFVGHNNAGDNATFAVAGIVVWLFIAAYWIGVWRTSVKWNPNRIGGTIAAAVVATIVGFLAGAFCNTIHGFGVFVGAALTPLLWLVGTVLIWRERAEERAERLKSASASAIVCPTCGYNLTGLTSTRCPECGAQLTIDQLLASQPKREAAEIEPS